MSECFCTELSCMVDVRICMPYIADCCMLHSGMCYVCMPLSAFLIVVC